MKSGSSGTATSNRDWMAAMTCWSASDDTKVIARPFVPKRPARLRGGKQAKEVRGSGKNAPDTVQVAVRIRRRVVVDDDVHALDIDTATEDIRRYQYTLLEVFEGLVAVDAGGDVSEAKTEV